MKAGCYGRTTAPTVAPEPAPAHAPAPAPAAPLAAPDSVPAPVAVVSMVDPAAEAEITVARLKEALRAPNAFGVLEESSETPPPAPTGPPVCSPSAPSPPEITPEQRRALRAITVGAAQGLFFLDSWASGALFYKLPVTEMPPPSPDHVSRATDLLDPLMTRIVGTHTTAGTVLALGELLVEHHISQAQLVAEIKQGKKVKEESKPKPRLALVPPEAKPEAKAQTAAPVKDESKSAVPDTCLTPPDPGDE